MFATKFNILHEGTDVLFVEMPDTHAYQLTALLQRLHKEVGKLTASNTPALPTALAECERLELTSPGYQIVRGLDYVSQLERQFSSLQESSYPLISLLTEIRALQAQLEQWYEEYDEYVTG